MEYKSTIKDSKKPFTLSWWKEQWVNAVSIHDNAIFNHDTKKAIRYGILSSWIDGRIRRYGKEI